MFEKNDLTRSVLLSICCIAAAVGTRSRCPANHRVTRLAKLISMVSRTSPEMASPTDHTLHRLRCTSTVDAHHNDSLTGSKAPNHGRTDSQHVQLRTAGCHNQTPAHLKSVATSRRIAAEENVTDAPRDCVLGPRTFNQATNLTRLDTWLCHATDTANTPDGQSSHSNTVALSILSTAPKYVTFIRPRTSSIL
jgi:hypothetical protein